MERAMGIEPTSEAWELRRTRGEWNRAYTQI